MKTLNILSTHLEASLLVDHGEIQERQDVKSYVTHMVDVDVLEEDASLVKTLQK